MRLTLKITLPGARWRVLKEERLFTRIVPSAEPSRWPSFAVSLLLQIVCIASLLRLSDHLQQLRLAEEEARTFYVRTAVVRLIQPQFASEPLPAASGPRPGAAPRLAALPRKLEPASTVTRARTAEAEAIPPVIEAPAKPFATAAALTALPSLPEPPLLLADAGLAPPEIAPDPGILIPPPGHPIEPASLTRGVGEPSGLAGLVQFVENIFHGVAGDRRGLALLSSYGYANAGRLSRGIWAITNRFFGSGPVDEQPSAEAVPESEPPSSRFLWSPQTFPANGAYDLVVMHSTAGDALPGSRLMLAGRPIYGVQLPFAHDLRWTLQFCTLRPSGMAQAGVLAITDGAPLVGPWPLEVTLPVVDATRWPPRAVLQGSVDEAGNVVGLSWAEGQMDPEQTASLIEGMRAWKFRPARQGASAVAVEFLLVVERP